jgi:RHS repeat-associated protein
MLQGTKDQPRVAAALFGGPCVLPLAAAPTSTTAYSCDARTLPKTRVRGSKPENVHCSSATSPLKIELRWGCEECSEKTAVGSGVSFKYDPFDRRIEKSSGSGTSIYAYDGDNLIEETNSSGNAVARYSDGLNIDEPLAMLRSATTSYYEADGLGSVTSLTSAAGAVAQTYSFDSFGNIVATTGSLTNSFRYTSREFDAETGLYFYRSRYFDPSAGRFLSEDPLTFRGGIDFYSYTRNRPVSNVDPFGTQEPVPVPTPSPTPTPGPSPTPIPQPTGPWPGFPFIPQPKDQVPIPPGCGEACTIPNYWDPGPPATPHPPLPPSGWDKDKTPSTMPNKAKCNSGRVSKCSPLGYDKQLRGCKYVCDDGTVWFQSGSCVDPLYKPWGDGFPKYPPIPKP